MPQVNLALSLHAPTQEARCKIVPTARQWHIDELIAVRHCFYHQLFFVPLVILTRTRVCGAIARVLLF